MVGSCVLCSLNLRLVVVLFMPRIFVGLVFVFGRAAFACQPVLDDHCHVFVDRAGVGLLFLDPKLGKQFENPVWLNF
jgi:hypothetical protein